MCRGTPLRVSPFLSPARTFAPYGLSILSDLTVGKVAPFVGQTFMTRFWIKKKRIMIKFISPIDSFLQSFFLPAWVRRDASALQTLQIADRRARVEPKLQRRNGALNKEVVRWRWRRRERCALVWNNR